MTENLLETDRAIESLLEELMHLKSTSQQLQNAEKNASQVIESTEKIANLSTQVLQGATKQFDAITILSDNTEKRMLELLAEQRAFANAIERFLRSDVLSRIERLNKITNVILGIVIANSAIVLISIAVILWLNQR